MQSAWPTAQSYAYHLQEVLARLETGGAKAIDYEGRAMHTGGGHGAVPEHPLLEEVWEAARARRILGWAIRDRNAAQRGRSRGPVRLTGERDAQVWCLVRIASLTMEDAGRQVGLDRRTVCDLLPRVDGYVLGALERFGARKWETGA